MLERKSRKQSAETQTQNQHFKKADDGREKNGRKPERDLNETAFSIVQQATGQAPKEEPKLPVKPEKNQAAMTLGRLGGLKGGKARAAKLTPEERRAIAKKAAEKRWKD